MRPGYVIIMLGVLVVAAVLLLRFGRRRSKPVDPSTLATAREMAKAGQAKQMTKEQIKALAGHVALNSKIYEGVVEQVLDESGHGRYLIRLADGSDIQASRSGTMWQRRIHTKSGDRVYVSIDSDRIHGMITRKL